MIQLIDRLAVMAFNQLNSQDLYQRDAHGLIGDCPELDIHRIQRRCDHAYLIAEQMIRARERAETRMSLADVDHNGDGELFESDLDAAMFDVVHRLTESLDGIDKTLSQFRSYVP